MGRLATRPQWAKEGRQPGEVGESPPPVGSTSRCELPPSATGLGAPRRGGELCPLEAMLLGTGEPGSWFMDWAPPAATWELSPPGEELGAELGSLEEMGAAFTEPNLTASSLGSWADEWEQAESALAAAEAQMGRGCPDESLGDDTATAEDQLEEEEDWESLTVLGTATAPPLPRPAGTVSQPPSQQEAPKSAQGLPPAKGTQRSLGSVPGKGVVNPKVGGAAIQGAPARRKPRCPCSPRGPEEDKIQVLKVQKGGLTLPARVKERQYDRDNQPREAVPLLAGEGLMVVKRLTKEAHRVRKIEFQKQRGKGHAAFEVRWETVAGPLAGKSSGR